MRRIRRMAVALAASAIVVGVMGAGSAQALSVKPCNGTGKIRVFDDALGPGVDLWRIDGVGNCPANLQLLLNPREPQQVSFNGTGISTGLGLCDGSGVVTNLFIQVRVAYRNAVTGVTTTETQFWHAPITTFPLATPYLMTKRLGHGLNSGMFGVGIAITRIALNCDNTGTRPAASFAWVELRQP